MISKYLEKKVRLDRGECTEENKFLMELEYYLTESEMEDDDLPDQKVYGLEIVKILGDLEVEKEFIRNFSCSRENAKDVLIKLANNTVTPMGLPFVLDDLIGV